MADFTKMTDELKQQLTEMVMGMVNEPVQNAVEQIPHILGRQDLSEDEKIDMVELLQLAIVTPFVGAAVNAAQACRLELGVFLNLNGHAWEEIRQQLMTQVGAEMLGIGREPEDGGEG
jgi:hypothetical protein